MCSPSGRPSISATTTGAPPPGAMRTILLSIRPAQMWPSPSTTTSSGASPGTGTTVSGTAGNSGSGSTGGGVQRTGSIGGLRDGEGTPEVCHLQAPGKPDQSSTGSDAMSNVTAAVEATLSGLAGGL